MLRRDTARRHGFCLVSANPNDRSRPVDAWYFSSGAMLALGLLALALMAAFVYFCDQV